MNQDAFAAALRNSLDEIRNICPDVRCSFIFTKDSVIVAGDAHADSAAMEKAARSFQSIAEKTDAVGGLDTLLIDGDKGKVYISCLDKMYLALTTSKDADIAYLRSITRVIVPTILKLLESILPTPLKFVPPQHLTVDTLSGFKARFSADTVEIHREILKQWSERFDGKDISQVEIEAFGGKTTQCKVKAINDSNLNRKGLIRIPEKTCQMLEVKTGELVRVKPIAPQVAASLWPSLKEIRI